MIDTDDYGLESYTIGHINVYVATAIRMRHIKCGEAVSSWSDSPSMKQLINTMYIHELECT